MNPMFAIDANAVYCDIKNLINLLNIIIDDFEDNGENAERRAMTCSALHVLYGQLALVGDMQAGLMGRLEEETRKNVQQLREEAQA